MPGHPASRPYRVEVPLRWSDMDAYGHVNNVQYLRLLEDARVVGFQEWFPDRPDPRRRGHRRVAARHRVPRAPHLPSGPRRGRHVGDPGARRGLRPRLRRPRPRGGGGAGVCRRRDRAGPLRLRDRPSPPPVGRGPRAAVRAPRATPSPSGGPAGERGPAARRRRGPGRPRPLRRAGPGDRRRRRDAPPGHGWRARGVGRRAPGRPASSPRARSSGCAPSRSPSRSRSTRSCRSGRSPTARRTTPAAPTSRCPRPARSPRGRPSPRRAARGSRPARLPGDLLASVAREGLGEVADAVRERGAAAGFVRDRVWARDVREAAGPHPDLLVADGAPDDRRDGARGRRVRGVRPGLPRARTAGAGAALEPVDAPHRARRSRPDALTRGDADRGDDREPEEDRAEQRVVLARARAGPRRPPSPRRCPARCRARRRAVATTTPRRAPPPGSARARAPSSS